jgi:hypothetical protein
VGERNETGEQEMPDAKALAKTERAILTFARREQPQSLQDLRTALAESSLGVDKQFVNLAILELLNTGRLDLSADRRLHVSG